MLGFGSMSRYTYVCIPCRYVTKSYQPCVHCKSEMKCMGTRWSAPRKNDDRAWKRIERGELMWNRRKVTKAKQKAWSSYLYNEWTPRPNVKRGQYPTHVTRSNKPKPVMPGK